MDNYLNRTTRSEWIDDDGTGEQRVKISPRGLGALLLLDAEGPDGLIARFLREGRPDLAMDIEAGCQTVRATLARLP